MMNAEPVYGTVQVPAVVVGQPMNSQGKTSIRSSAAFPLSEQETAKRNSKRQTRKQSQHQECKKQDEPNKSACCWLLQNLLVFCLLLGLLQYLYCLASLYLGHQDFLGGRGLLSWLGFAPKLRLMVYELQAAELQQFGMQGHAFHTELRVDNNLAYMWGMGSMSEVSRRPWRSAEGKMAMETGILPAPVDVDFVPRPDLEVELGDIKQVDTQKLREAVAELKTLATSLGTDLRLRKDGAGARLLDWSQFDGSKQYDAISHNCNDFTMHVFESLGVGHLFPQAVQNGQNAIRAKMANPMVAIFAALASGGNSESHARARESHAPSMRGVRVIHLRGARSPRDSY